MKPFAAAAFAAVAIALAVCGCQRLLLGPDRAANTPPSPHATRFETILDSLRYALDMPALAGAIVTDSGTLQVAAVGSRRWGGPANVTINDQFHLGSDTKAMTAALIGTLVDEGKVAWGTTLPQIFPELAGTMRTQYRDVTVREVLSHSAGLLRDFGRTFDGTTPREQRVAAVAWALAQSPIGPRGTYSYSNVGYVIAGAIAERLADGQYEDLLLARVLRPLGVTTAGFGPMGTPGLEDEPLQHTGSHAPVEPTPSADNQPIYSSAGRLHLSIGDWARWATWVLAAEAGHQTLLADSTARALTDSAVAIPGAGAYALGWSILQRDWAGGRSLQHCGSNNLSYAEIALAPGPRFGVLVATNQGPGVLAIPTDPAVGRLILFHLDGR